MPPLSDDEPPQVILLAEARPLEPPDLDRVMAEVIRKAHIRLNRTP